VSNYSLEKRRIKKLQFIVKHDGRLKSITYYGLYYEKVKEEILYDRDNEFERRNKTSTNFVKLYL
jgi:hypothetical protein